MSFTSNSIFFIQVNIKSRKLWRTNNLLQGTLLQNQYDALSLSVFCLISIPSKYPNNRQAYNQPTYNPGMFVAFNQTYSLLDIIPLEPWDWAQFSTKAESIVWSGCFYFFNLMNACLKYQQNTPPDHLNVDDRVEKQCNECHSICTSMQRQILWIMIHYLWQWSSVFWNHCTALSVSEQSHLPLVTPLYPKPLWEWIDYDQICNSFNQPDKLMWIWYHR